MAPFSGQAMTERVADSSSPIGLIAAGGVRPSVVADSLVARGLLMPGGCLTLKAPDESAAADIARGHDVLRALSPFDIGQAAVVIDSHVVGVEDIEGTDGLLARVAWLRKEGRIRANRGRG